MYLQAIAVAEYKVERITIMLNERRFDPEKIALAIVASSSPALSISDKLQLYMDAYEACEESLSRIDDETAN